jgi:hypothetical protein
VNFNRQCAITGIAMLAASVLTLFSTASVAQPLGPCDFTGENTITPAHPQAKDILTFDILIEFSRPPADVVLSKTTLAAGNQIMFDVVSTPLDSVAMFPGYQSDPVFPGEVVEGTFGPLAVGQYTVTTSVRVYDPANGFTSPCSPNGPMTRSLIVYADDGLSPVIEYYYALLDHYFITQFKDEIAALDAGVHPGWVRTGQSFLAYRPGQGVGQPVQRWYGLPSAGLDTHFFTMNVPDITFLYTHPSAWERESTDAFDLDFHGAFDCAPGEVPVYRLWNQRVDSNHRYTTDPAIKAQMIAKGYVAEGYGPDAIMMCAFTRQVP